MDHDDSEGQDSDKVEHLVELRVGARMAIACSRVCVDSRTADRLTHQHESKEFFVVVCL